jgi:hypothetical protein
MPFGSYMVRVQTAVHVSTAADAHPTANRHGQSTLYASGGYAWVTETTHTHSGETQIDLREEFIKTLKSKGKEIHSSIIVDYPKFEEINDILVDYQKNVDKLTLDKKLYYIEKLIGVRL